jgi:hypothetical protein
MAEMFVGYSIEPEGRATLCAREPALGRGPRSGKPSEALDCFMAKKNRVVENGGADLKVAEP